MAQSKSPGLTYRRRKDGSLVPYWVASAEARQAGYPIRTRNLSRLPAEYLEAECRSMQLECADWLARQGSRTPAYDGTIRSIIDIYKTHDLSPLRRAQASTRRVYDGYLLRIRADVGKRRIALVNGLDLIRWHREWSSDGSKPAAGAMAVAVLKAALSFGSTMRLPGCADLRLALACTHIPKPRPRTEAPTARQVDAFRAAAHAAGWPSLALAAAIQFEGAVRLWDVIGKWVPLDDPAPSAVHHAGMKWLGLRWEMIDAQDVLTFTPAKTSRTTGKSVSLDLSACPMVVEEMYLDVPQGTLRSGPLIVCEQTGQPWLEQPFRRAFGKIKRAAGWPSSMWARDLRAGGLTEASKGGASADDRAKVGGHSKRMTATVYDRDQLEAARRVKAAGLAHRAKDEK